MKIPVYNIFKTLYERIQKAKATGKLEEEEYSKVMGGYWVYVASYIKGLAMLALFGVCSTLGLFLMVMPLRSAQFRVISERLGITDKEKI